MRVFATVAACLTAALAGGRPALAAPPARPPNVLFVLIDDMGYGDLTCYGNTRVHTDNIDQLAREGVRFTQFTVAAPICSPSRAGLLTGQRPARWHITSYLDNRAANRQRGVAQWLDVSAPTVARGMHDAGYATGHFGKWHLGGQRDVGDAPLITAYGFDQSLTQFEGLGDRILPLLNAYDGKPPREYALGSDKLGHGHITWMDRAVVTTGFVTAAIDFIKKAEAADRPFYVDVWPDDVHSPFFPPKDLRGDESKRQRYLGVVQATDSQLAPLLDLIRNDPKLRDNTLVVLASDNGPEPGAGLPGPFRGQKGNLHEGGIREPLIAWGPGLIDPAAAGTTDERTVVNGVDLLPSLMGVIGHPMPAGQTTDGEDQSRALLGHPRPEGRSGPLFWVRPPDRGGSATEPWPDLAVRRGDWKLLLNVDGSRPELYDLAKDPGERTNVAADHADVVADLGKMVRDWYQKVDVKLLPPAPGNAHPGYMGNDPG